MQKPFIFLIIGLFFGTGFGYLLADTTSAELAGHDHSAHDIQGHTDQNHSESGQ